MKQTKSQKRRLERAKAKKQENNAARIAAAESKKGATTAQEFVEHFTGGVYEFVPKKEMLIRAVNQQIEMVQSMREKHPTATHISTDDLVVFKEEFIAVYEPLAKEALDAAIGVEDHPTLREQAHYVTEHIDKLIGLATTFESYIQRFGTLTQSYRDKVISALKPTPSADLDDFTEDSTTSEPEVEPTMMEDVKHAVEEVVEVVEAEVQELTKVEEPTSSELITSTGE